MNHKNSRREEKSGVAGRFVETPMSIRAGSAQLEEASFPVNGAAAPFRRTEKMILSEN